METEEEYAIRRLQFAAGKLRDQNKPILAWNLIRKAGLRPGYPDRVIKELELFVSDNKKQNFK
jgi:hypothetical protein